MELPAPIIGQGERPGSTVSCQWQLPQVRILCLSFIRDGDVGVVSLGGAELLGLRQPYPAQQVGVAGVGAHPVPEPVHP
jgi:hypothetical protein